MTQIHDIVIIGGGTVGHTAATYTARPDLRPVIFEGSVTAGGALYTTTDVENYPGFPEAVQGPDLIDTMRKQAEKFGATYSKPSTPSTPGSPARFPTVPEPGVAQHLVDRGVAHTRHQPSEMDAADSIWCALGRCRPDLRPCGCRSSPRRQCASAHSPEAASGGVRCHVTVSRSRRPMRSRRLATPSWMRRRFC